MQCSECNESAIVRVRVNGDGGVVVCEVHRTAIVRRMEQVARKCWDGNQNQRAVFVKAVQNIDFENLPIELPASTVL